MFIYRYDIKEPDCGSGWKQVQYRNSNCKLCKIKQT